MSSANYTRDAVEQFYWCFAEVNVGIVCAAAPALKPFFMRHLPALLKSGRGDGTTEGTPGGSGRRRQSQSYELRGRPEGASDEAKLWRGKIDQDASSVDSSRHTVVVTTGEGRGEGEGINVVKETTVNYNGR
jgi:hypothetical protein